MSHILDSGILADVTRGDANLIGFLQNFDQAGHYLQPLGLVRSQKAPGA